MKLYYRECGKGQPMILLHGNGEDSIYFENQIRFFSKKYRVIAIDTRGHGKSPRGTRPFTVEQFAKDLKGFLDEKRLRHIILLGICGPVDFKRCELESIGSKSGNTDSDNCRIWFLSGLQSSLPIRPDAH